MGATKFTIRREAHAIASADAGNALYRVRVSAPAGRAVDVRLISIALKSTVAAESARVRIHKASTGGTFTAIADITKRSDNTDTVETTAGHTGAGGAITPGGVVAQELITSQGGKFVRAYGEGECRLAGGQNLDVYIAAAGTFTGTCEADIEIDAEE